MRFFYYEKIMEINDIKYLSQILHKAEALKSLLEQEFQALKLQDLQQFEKLQEEKTKVLEILSEEEFVKKVQEFHSNSTSNSPANTEIPIQSLELWDQIVKSMTEGRTLHQRNEILINSKIESIRSALRTLQSPDPLNSVEVYDKLGKLTGANDRNKVGEA